MNSRLRSRKLVGASWARYKEFNELANSFIKIKKLNPSNVTITRNKDNVSVLIRPNTLYEPKIYEAKTSCRIVCKEPFIMNPEWILNLRKCTSTRPYSKIIAHDALV